MVTTNGLQRYDGSRFVNYSERMNSSFELNDDANVYADSLNRIWIPKLLEMRKLETTKNIFTAYEPEQLIKDGTWVDHRLQWRH